VSHPASMIRDLLDGTLPWPQVHQLMSGYKDEGRFPVFRTVMQERVAWNEPIVLPLSPRLFIVDRGDRGVVRCACGHDFCDWRENWKLHARVLARDTQELLGEVFALLPCDPDWMEIREFICPGCAALLEVDAAVPGYPVMHDFLPDLDVFYREWLGEAPPSWVGDVGG
jgi:acetone carboxylase gamma subunit